MNFCLMDLRSCSNSFGYITVLYNITLTMYMFTVCACVCRLVYVCSCFSVSICMYVHVCMYACVCNNDNSGWSHNHNALYN